MTNSDYLKRLSQIESPDCTYTKASPPLVFESAQGSFIRDVQGHEYIDLCAGFGVMALGHNSDEIRSVFENQLSSYPPIVHGMGDVYPSEAKIHFIEQLLQMLPEHLNRASLSITGAQAVEVAVKTCILRNPSGHIITFEGSYHGVDLGILPFTSRDDFKSPFKNWIADELVLELPFGAPPELIQKEIENLPGGLSAILVEPVQGRAGILSPPHSWLKSLRDICDKQNAMLVFDEVFTGMGRTGAISSSFEVKADLICLGKALGGGLPISACVGTEEAFRVWPVSQGEAIHTGTFFGHPLACRLGSKIIKKVAEKSFLTEVNEKGMEALKFLRSSLAGHPQVKRIDGCGLMLVIEFSEAGRGADLMNSLRSDRVIALASGPHGESLSVTPALNIPMDVLSQGLEKIVQCISKNQE